MFSTMPYTQSQLIADLKSLEVAQGQFIMLHSSVKAVSPVMDGPNVTRYSIHMGVVLVIIGILTLGVGLLTMA